MPTPVAFNQVPFRTANGTHDRTISEWWTDYGVCVAEFANLHTPDGEAGYATGTGNDAPCFTAAFEKAFKTAGEWNGLALCHKNLPVYVPAAQYNFTSELYLEKVVGGQIRGAGKAASRMRYGPLAPPSVLTPFIHMNGCSDMFWDCLGIYTTGLSGTMHDSKVGVFHLDWDGDNSGNGCNGNKHNHFQDTGIGGGEVGVRIGRSGSATSGGQGMLFDNCTLESSNGNYGYVIEGPNSWATIIGGGSGGKTNGVGVHCPSGGGSVFTQGMANQGNAEDYLMESGGVMYIGQHRSESVKLFRLESGVLTLNSSTGSSGLEIAGEINGGICNIEGNDLHSLLDSQIIGTGGELYIWATTFATSVTPLSGYSGTVRWNPANLT